MFYTIHFILFIYLPATCSAVWGFQHCHAKDWFAIFQLMQKLSEAIWSSIWTFLNCEITSPMHTPIYEKTPQDTSYSMSIIISEKSCQSIIKLFITKQCGPFSVTLSILFWLLLWLLHPTFVRAEFFRAVHQLLAYTTGPITKVLPLFPLEQYSVSFVVNSHE